MLRFCLFIFIVATPLFTPNATTIRALNIEQRSARADRIVVATVSSIQFQKAEQGKRIYTLTTLKVIEAVKGKVQRDMHLVVRQIGGQIGEWSQHVPGDARFQEGTEVLVFLRHDPADDLHFLVGMGQGKINVDVDADQVGAAKPEPQLQVFKHHRHPAPATRTQSLTALIQQIRAATAPSRP